MLSCYGLGVDEAIEDEERRRNRPKKKMENELKKTKKEGKRGQWGKKLKKKTLFFNFTVGMLELTARVNELSLDRIF